MYLGGIDNEKEGREGEETLLTGLDGEAIASNGMVCVQTSQLGGGYRSRNV